MHLVAGKEWPKQIHEFMAKCHAAVILLTENAVPSDWVLKEATILAWRASNRRELSVFSSRRRGVTQASLEEEKFKPLLLDSIQKIKCRRTVESRGQSI